MVDTCWVAAARCSESARTEPRYAARVRAIANIPTNARNTSPIRRSIAATRRYPPAARTRAYPPVGLAGKPAAPVGPTGVVPVPGEAVVVEVETVGAVAPVDAALPEVWLVPV